MKKINSTLKIYGVLHILLIIYSLTGIFSKLAGKEKFLSFQFCLYYGIVIFFLGIYAIGWQQILKYLPLTTAFANKAAIVVWGIIWGVLFFDEQISVGKLIGAVIVIVGVISYALADRGQNG
ncbi:MAG: transporter [Lachnospiraceae bacterium]|nr:transporter [Lachnospiraceae bacterium]